MPPRAKEKPPLTEAQEQTILDFVAWYAGNGYTQQKAADLLECSGTTLSEIINGIYPGNTAKYVRAMAEVLERARQDEGLVRRVPFVMTSVAEKIISFCDLCRSMRRMGFVRTKTGIGKTQALTAYAEEHKVTCVKVTCMKNFTSRRLLMDLARRFDLAWQGAEAHMFRQVVAQLRTSGHPLLIVDEADYLGAARDTVRHLHDQAEIGVVLGGTAAFLEKLQKRPASTDGQLLRRLVYRLDIDKIFEEDGRQLAAFFKLSAAAWQRAWDVSYANAARLVDTLFLARRFAGDGEISPKHVATAAANIPLPAEL